MSSGCGELVPPRGGRQGAVPTTHRQAGGQPASSFLSPDVSWNASTSPINAVQFGKSHPDPSSTGPLPLCTGSEITAGWALRPGPPGAPDSPWNKQKAKPAPAWRGQA